jgi:hypothetical protein
LVTHCCPHCGRRFNTWVLTDAPAHVDQRGAICSDPARVRRALALVLAGEKQLGDDVAPPRRHGQGECGGSTKGIG